MANGVSICFRGLISQVARSVYKIQSESWGPPQKKFGGQKHKKNSARFQTTWRLDGDNVRDATESSTQNSVAKGHQSRASTHNLVNSGPQMAKKGTEFRPTQRRSAIESAWNGGHNTVNS